MVKLDNLDRISMLWLMARAEAMCQNRGVCNIETRVFYSCWEDILAK